MPLANRKIDPFMIDPPWPKKKSPIRTKGTASTFIDTDQKQPFHYKTLSVKEIFLLLDQKIFSLASPQHVVFVWSIDQFLHESEAQMADRGYRLHARIIWNKKSGLAPAFSIQYAHEYLLWFYKPKFIPINQDYRGRFTTIISEDSRQHSRKPESAYKMLDKMYPELSKMDVFTRYTRPGWLPFGDQKDYYNVKPRNRTVPVTPIRGVRRA